MDEIMYSAEQMDAVFGEAMGFETSALIKWYTAGVMAEWRISRKLDTGSKIADRTSVSAGSVSKCRTIARKWKTSDAMLKALDRANAYHTIENAYEIAKGVSTSEVKFSASKVASGLEKKYTKAQLRKIVAELNEFLA